MEHVGQLVRHHRARIGLTQEELARNAGVSPTTVVRIESGDIRRPQQRTLVKLARALNLDHDKLVWFWPELPEAVDPTKTGPFTAVFERDGDWWIGYVEELPGANAQERTLEEARESLREAVSDILEANRELTRTEFEGQEVVREPLSV